MKTRNRVIDIIKLICSIMVIFLHFSFPGKLGYAIFSIARFAVPTFFVVSGYFYYKTDKDRQSKTTKKKAWHIFKLLLISETLSLVQSVLEIYRQTNRLDFHKAITDSIVRYGSQSWRLISFTPLFNYSAWFLVQLIVCYFLFHIFSRLNILQKAKYFIAGMFVLGFLLVRSQFLLGFQLPPYTDYFILFMGLPFFALGYYYREYTIEHSDFCLKVQTHSISLMIIAGIALTLIEAYFISSVSLYLGSVLIVFSFMLMWEKEKDFVLHNYPTRIMSYLGANITLLIYILHGFVGGFPLNTIYHRLSSFISIVPSSVFDYFYPVAVCICTVGISLLVNYIIMKLRRK